MVWELAQHNGFKRELSKPDGRDAGAVRAALHRLKDQLDRVGTLDPRKVFSLPDAHLVLLTVVAKRDDSTYDKLPQLHRKRFADR